MKRSIALILAIAFCAGCKDDDEYRNSLNDLLLGSYSGALMYWIPKDSTKYQVMYSACPIDTTKIELSPNGYFVMQLTAGVERLDTTCAIHLSGQYSISKSQYVKGSGWQLSLWHCQLDFFPNEYPSFQTFVTIADHAGALPSTDYSLLLPDSSSLYVNRWLRNRWSCN